MLDTTSGPQSLEASAGPLSVRSRHRKVAILGFGDTAKHAPWTDPTWELWAMNGFWRATKPDLGVDVPEERYSCWFDIHTLDFTRVYGQKAGFGDAQEKWLQKEHPFPIFMIEESPHFPSVIRFPLEDVIEKTGRAYFTSTVAYALAYALSLPDVAEIGLWGIDLIHETEYADQRPCAEYWIGRIEAAGIKVQIHEKSALLKQRHLYAYEPDNPLLVEMCESLDKQISGLKESVAKAQAEIERMQCQANTDHGALQAFQALRARLEMWRRGGAI